MSTELKVNMFLFQLKSNYENGNYYLARRKDEKINKLLRELTWTRAQLFEYLINNLKTEDYVNGPEKEHGNPDGSVWIFNKVIQNKDVYIKISNLPNGSKCISFHESEY